MERHARPARQAADVAARWPDADLYRAETVTAIREGQAISEGDYAAARQDQALFKARIADAMDAAGIDLWIAPATTGPAPASLATTGSSMMCVSWSYAGLPSISLPAGFAAAPDSTALPLGLQCVARAGADERLLAWAVGLEAALDFKPTSARPARA